MTAHECATEHAEAPQPVVRDDVVLTQPQPAIAVAYEAPPAPQAEPDEPLHAGPFIPPRPERPVVAPAPRMPRIEELPLPAQDQIRASRGEPSPPRRRPTRSA